MINFTNESTAQKFELVWDESFNYSGKPDPAKWNYETGYIRNQEHQYYTKRKKNVRVKDGKLIITARKEAYKNKAFDKDSTNWRHNKEIAEYTSGSINTFKKFHIQYGKIEVRAKLPKGNGIWAAIWMMSIDLETLGWPNAGEIDIMEYVGKEPNTIHSTVHYPWENFLGYASKGGKIDLENLTEDFHTYTIVWDAEKIDFMVDSNSYFSFNLAEISEENHPFRRPFYLIINLALGGNWPGKIDKSIFPQEFIIDYVKVYKKVD
ncbi:family 16 glycosylhydrolase [Mesonia sp. K7]|uniref:glycoside hydrolase family 16 protein n=1 Tax=Mesonia sp. K7 TaxID=2218606 RepID=UPI000DAA50FE|nr:glycoside hydrolase family 16 protein [Mesonia sp. K7]PZD79421.1 glycoside hydrolase family 16 protein [Mesonia sp. K7]